MQETQQDPTKLMNVNASGLRELRLVKKATPSSEELREIFKNELRTFRAEQLQSDFQALLRGVQEEVLRLFDQREIVPCGFVNKPSAPEPKRRVINCPGLAPKSNQLDGQAPPDGLPCCLEFRQEDSSELALSSPKGLHYHPEMENSELGVIVKASNGVTDHVEHTRLRALGCAEDSSLPGTVEELVVESGSPDDSDDAVTATFERDTTRKSDASTKAKQISRVIFSHKGRSKKARVSILRDRSNWQTLLLELITNKYFDLAVAVTILLNGVVVGIQTHVMAVDSTDKAPLFYEVVELIFCAIFTVELSIRLFALRLKFFTMPGQVGWNIFDLVVVSAQLIELLMQAVASGIGFSFNLMRTLRLVRVLRIARTLRLIGELRTIVSSIVSSMKPLFWTGVLLFMVVYVLGVYVTQVVLHQRMDYKEDHKELPPELMLYWGDLIKSIFSLFQSITGGVDWDQVARPLIDRIGPEMGVLYCLYITFTMFAMLNVVTGVFIQAVIENKTAESEYRTRADVKKLFKNLDTEHTGEITWAVFESQLERKDMREFFKTIDVDICNAKALFDLLDTDSSGSVDCEEFLEGCLRLWAPARGYDQRIILRELRVLKSSLEAGIGQRQLDPNRFSIESGAATEPLRPFQQQFSPRSKK